jgi:hypothetical protein
VYGLKEPIEWRGNSLCEGDLAGPRRLEDVYDVRTGTKLTHGFFAGHLHMLIWPQILLRDFGIDGLASYVGYVDWQWWERRDKELENNIGTLATQALPPKMIFTKAFLDDLPTFFVYGKINARIGNLKWYRTIQTEPQEQFVTCEMQGHQFVWHLEPTHKETCKDGCHTVGLWRD